MNIYEYLASIGKMPAAIGKLPAALGGGGPPPGGALPPAPKVPALSPRMLPGPLQQGPSAPSGGGGFLAGVDRLLGGQAMQGLDPAQAADARRQGLLAAGAQMLLASSPQFWPPVGLPAILAQGVLAGQQGYGQGIEQGYGRQQAEAAQQRRMELQRVLTPRPNETLQDTYARLNAAAGLAAGDESTQGMVPQIVQAMKDLPQQFGGPRRPNLVFSELTNKDGTIERVGQDPMTGEVVSRQPWGAARSGFGGLTAYQQLLTDNRTMLGENAMADDYRAQTKDVQTAADNYGIITSSAEAASRGDAAAQIAMVFAFMKMQDPGSVVRESEYATAENARGVAEDVRNIYNRLLKGARLTPEQVQRFTGQAERSAGYWRRRQDSTQAQYRRRIENRGYNPDNVLFDYFGAVPGPGSGGDIGGWSPGPPPPSSDLGDPFANEAPAIPVPPAERGQMLSSEEVRRQALQREMAKWLHTSRTIHRGGR